MNNQGKNASMPPPVPMRRGGGPMGARMNVEKPKHTKKTVARLLHYIGKSSAILLVLVVIMFAVTAAELLGPFFQANAIDTIQKDAETGRLTVDLDAMRGYLVMMAIMFAVSAVLSYFQEILAARLSLHTVRAMRNDLFRKISRLPISYTDSHRHGDIMSRMTNDVENVSGAISQSITVSESPRYSA
jgi:ATP-binding cassette subfamily B protein